MKRKSSGKAFGTEKGYLLFRIELAILLSAIISVLYTLFKSELYLLQIVPAALLFKSLAELRSNHSRDFLPYASIFSILFIVVIAVPFLFKATMFSNPLEMFRIIVLAAIALMVLLLFSKLLLKRDVYGRVIMADRETAVVETDVDLIAGIRAGRYVVNNNGAKKGDIVRMSVRKGFFRGSYLDSIIAKV